MLTLVILIHFSFTNNKLNIAVEGTICVKFIFSCFPNHDGRFFSTAKGYLKNVSVANKSVTKIYLQPRCLQCCKTIPFS